MPPALIFDLDGTLIDSAPDLAVALNRLLAEHGREPVSVAAVRGFIGDGARPLVARGFAATGPALAPEELDQALTRFLAIYGAMRADPACVYPGVADTLRQLAAAGHPMAVCTNKPAAIARSVLADVGLAPLFGTVVGGDTLPRRKPDPDPLLHAVQALGRTAADAVMVGDNANDVAAARAARMPCIAVAYGYPRMDPTDLGADLLIDRFANLGPALARLSAPVEAD